MSHRCYMSHASVTPSESLLKPLKTGHVTHSAVQCWKWPCFDGVLTCLTACTHKVVQRCKYPFYPFLCDCTQIPQNTPKYPKYPKMALLTTVLKTGQKRVKMALFWPYVLKMGSKDYRFSLKQAKTPPLDQIPPNTPK